MILSELARYLAAHRRAALPELACHFDADPEAVRGMLDLLARKGRVRRLANGSACGGCAKCDASTIETFEWIAASGP